MNEENTVDPAGTSPEKPSSPIAEHLNRKHMLIEELEHLVNDLEKRLQPVIRSIKPEGETLTQAGGVTASDVSSVVSQTLSSQNIKLEGLGYRIRNLIKNLEI